MKYFLAMSLMTFTFDAFSACGYTLTVPALNYTVSGSNPRVSTSLTLARTNQGGNSCTNFVVGFSKGGANSYTRIATNASTGSTLAYNIYKTSGTTTTLKSTTDATASTELVSGTISKSSSTSPLFYFELGTLSTTSLTRGGVYTDSLTVEARPGSFGAIDALEDSTTFSISINVPKTASLSLVNSGASYDSASTSKTLDFGELTEAEELSFDVIVLSNAGYSLSVSSANNQSLVISGLNNPAAKIGYDFYANNAIRDLSSSSSSPINLSSGTNVTPMQGTRIPIRVVINSVDGKLAGSYQDSVTFTIATTE